jgi:hypothetical protein
MIETPLVAGIYIVPAQIGKQEADGPDHTLT